MLEAIRGRRNIFLLFKDNKLLPFAPILKDVCENGSIDIAILCLNTQHLLPPEIDQSEMYLARFADERIEKGFLNIEEAGSLLGLRQASRKGDEIVI